MSINITNILLIILIIFILNNIKFDSFIIPETFQTINLNEENEFKIPKRTPLYGDIQYELHDYDNYKPDYKYQNFDIIKEKKSNVNLLNKYNDLTKMNTDIPKKSYDIIYEPEYNNVFKKTDLPCQQDIIYDTKFFQPSDADIYNPINYNNINYTERKIQDVYDDLVNNVQKNNPPKKLKEKKNNLKTGGFSENVLTNLEWEYEDEEDGMNYDPNLSNLLAL